MPKKLLFAVCLLFVPLIHAQQTRVVPDCVIPFNFTAPASTVDLTCGHNTTGVVNWVLVYSSTGFSALSLVVESAPDSGGTPGAWATFAGTVLTSAQYIGSSGINPNTAITSANTGFAGYFPWNRVTLSTVTGTGKITGALYGFLNSTLAKAGGGSGGGPTIAGTANQITVTGVGCTAAGTCTISIPSNAALPGAPTTTTAALGDNSTKIATTAFIANAFAGCTFITGALTCPGPITSGLGSGLTGALDVTGNTSGATSTITVDDANTATTVKIPNDATAGLYLPTSPTATPAAGCAQYSGTSTEVTSTSTPCGGGTGTPGSTLFSTTDSTAVTATSPTTLIGTVTGSTTIPANTFAAGQFLMVVAEGFYTTPATPASLTIALSIGGSVRITTGPIVQIASVTNGTWRLSCGVTTRTAGVGGTQIANCIFEGTGATLTPGESPLQTSSTWAIDTTATNAVDLLATWSTSVGAPTITSTNVVSYIPGAPSSSGTTVTAAPPYVQIGTPFFVAYNMYQATKPTAPTYLNAVGCSTSTTGTNGDLLLTNTSPLNCFGGYTGAASVEADFGYISQNNSGAAAGIWLWDSTNNNLYTWKLVANSGGIMQLGLYRWSYNGSGNPSFSAILLVSGSATVPAHLKLSVSAGTLTASVSLNGGANLVALATVGSIGTISKGGFILDQIGILDLYSLVVV